jgi:hypothetical protein
VSTLAFAVVGYLAGSIPTGYWLVRALRGEDIRRVGSGNIGATNVWRTSGARYGVPVMLLDTLKGFVPALLAAIYVGALAGVIAGGAAMLGHWRPCSWGSRAAGRWLRPAAARSSALLLWSAESARRSPRLLSLRFTGRTSAACVREPRSGSGSGAPPSRLVTVSDTAFPASGG